MFMDEKFIVQEVKKVLDNVDWEIAKSRYGTSC